MKSFVEFLEVALDCGDCDALYRLGENEEWATDVNKQPELEANPSDPVAYALAKGREALRLLRNGKVPEAYDALSEGVRANPSLGRGKALELVEKLAGCLGKSKEQESWKTMLEEDQKTWNQAPPGLALLAALQEVPAEWWGQFFELKGKAQEFSKQESGAENRKAPRLKLPEALWDGLLNWVERMVGKGGQEPYPVLGLITHGSFDSSRKPPWLEQAEREGYWEDRSGVIRVHPGDTAQTVRVNLEAAPEMQGGVLLLESGEQRALLLLPFGGERHREKVRLTATEGERLRAQLWSRETLRPRVLKALLAQAAVSRARLLDWIREGLELGRLEGRGWKRFLEELEDVREHGSEDGDKRNEREMRVQGGHAMFGVASIRAQELTLRQLLEGSKVYKVPLFQRPYTWGQENWERLWEDLESTYETNKTSSGTTYRHFLGPILTVAHPGTPAGIAPYTIVDGQQRLVTVALLLAAIRDKATAHGLSPLPNILDDLLKNRYVTPPGDLKIQPTYADQASFEKIVRPRPPATHGSMVEKVYDFFCKQLDEWIKSHSPADLEQLANALLDQMVVVHITLGEKDSAYRIFESLNYKGVPLTIVDLVRNYLFMHVPAESAASVHATDWIPIEEAYKKEFPPSPKNSTRHLEEMSNAVWHYVRMDGAEIRRPDAYAELVAQYDAWVRGGKPSEDFIRDMVASLEDYLHFKVPRLEPAPFLPERFEALTELKFGAAAPLVLALKKRVRGGILTEKTAADVLEVLEAYYVHRLLAGLPTNSLSRLVLEVLRHGILDTKDPVGELRNFLKGRPRETRWPSEAEVESGILKENLEAYAPYLLRRLERRLWAKLKVSEFPKLDGLTLEHIMPRKLNKDWESELGAEWARVHSQYLRTLPNLTLTGYNSAMGNKPYADKLDYFKKSNLWLNQEYFGKRAPKRWDEEALQDRGEWLLNLIFDVWK